MKWECKFCREEFDNREDWKDHEEICIMFKKELECPDYDDPYRICSYDFNF